jgi:GAF domain-containing protein
MYQRQPGRPSARQKELIAQITHVASIAIERAEGEAAVKRSEAFLAEAQRLSRIGSFFLARGDRRDRLVGAALPHFRASAKRAGNVRFDP